MGGAVECQTAGFLTDATRNSYQITGFIVNDSDARLQLLGTVGFGDVLQILINLIHHRLDIRIHRAVDGQATGSHHLFRDFLRVVICLTQVFRHIADHLVHKIGIVFAVVVITFCLLAAGVGKYHLLVDGSSIGFFCQNIALVIHLPKNRQLPLPIGFRVDIRIIIRGILGNANQAGTLGGGQLRHILAEVDAGCALHAVAAFL